MNIYNTGCGINMPFDEFIGINIDEKREFKWITGFW